MILDLASRLAKLVVNYSTHIQANDSVFIEGTTEAIPLINEIYREVLRAGGHPLTRVIPPGQQYIFMSEAQDHQIEYQNPFDLHMIQQIDAFIRIYSDINISELNTISPEKTRKAKAAEAGVMKVFFERASSGSLKWCVIPWATNAKAQKAMMSTEEFSGIIEKACFLDQLDPAAEWKKLELENQKIVDYLNTVSELHILAPGTDLTMSVKGRRWINCCGANDLPDGEVFTGPLEDSVNGVITFSYPARRAEGIRLTFQHGKVVEFSAQKGQEYMAEMLKIAGADRLGEIGIGTNFAHTHYVGEILCDEKMGGSIHLALGASYPESGGVNESSLHWDILTDMVQGGKMLADGKLFYQDGKFLI
jgi:aminopeptidase